jgi:hypothetical protein
MFVFLNDRKWKWRTVDRLPVLYVLVVFATGYEECDSRFDEPECMTCMFLFGLYIHNIRRARSGGLSWDSGGKRLGRNDLFLA